MRAESKYLLKNPRYSCASGEGLRFLALPESQPGRLKKKWPKVYFRCGRMAHTIHFKSASSDSSQYRPFRTMAMGRHIKAHG
jgi:hypothetical protein